MSRVAQVHSVSVLRVLLLLLSGALVDGRLHLLQDVVDLMEVVLGAEVRHRRQVVMLRQGSGSVSYTSSDGEARRVARDELCSQWAVQRGMNGHQGAADLAVRRRINLAALDTAKEVVELIVAALAGVECGGLVTHLISARVHGRWLVVVQRLIGLGLVVRVVATVTVLMRLTKGCRVSTNGTVMVIVARGR